MQFHPSFSQIVEGATGKIVAAFDTAGTPNVPEVCLSQDFEFSHGSLFREIDVSQMTEGRDAYVGLLVSAIGKHLIEIIHQHDSRMHLNPGSINPFEMRALIVAIHNSLRLHQLQGPQGITHQAFRLPTDFPARALFRVRTGEGIDRSLQRLTEQLTQLFDKRLELLHDFFKTPPGSRRLGFIPYIDRNLQEIGSLREDIRIYCETGQGLDNPFIPPEDRIAAVPIPPIHQNNQGMRGDLLREFQPSTAERIILGNKRFSHFERQEWDLFRFSFCHQEDQKLFEDMGFPYDMAFLGEQEVMYRKMLERKMLLVYSWYAEREQERLREEFSEDLGLLESTIHQIESEIREVQIELAHIEHTWKEINGSD